MAASRLLNDIAHALIAAAKDEDAVHRVVSDLKSLGAMFETEPALLADLAEKAVPEDKRREALTKALGDHIHPFAQNTLLTLLTNDLLTDLPAFLTNVLAEAEDLANHRDVRVTSAVPLNDDERKDLAEMVKKKFKGTHTLTEQVDPSLLGGLIVDIGDWHVDASIKGKLTRLTHTLNA